MLLNKQEILVSHAHTSLQILGLVVSLKHLATSWTIVSYYLAILTQLAAHRSADDLLASARHGVRQDASLATWGHLCC